LIPQKSVARDAGICSDFHFSLYFFEQGGYKKMPYAAFCFESQQEPASPSRGGAILRKGEVYRHRTVYEIKQI
jgi:galactose mutarotase-like enzyme